MKKILSTLFAIVGFATLATPTAVDPANDVSLSVRQGNTAKNIPFWNGHASFFRYAPAFEFKTVPGAVHYRFALNGKDGAVASFVADSPEASLSPVWNGLANTQWTVVCEGIDAEGKTLGKAGERIFVKTAQFTGNYKPARRSYRDAARMIYEYMTSLPAMNTLVKTGIPDQNYQHNAYPSKTHAAHVAAMLKWAEFDPKNKGKAIRFAIASGEYLLSQLEPADAPLAFWPPTYGRKPLDFDPNANGGKNRKSMVGNDPEGAAKYRGQVMTLYPADVGVQFIALAKATGERKYLEAAKGIGETYLKIKRSDGTWALKYCLETGEVVCPNPLVPTKPMVFFERLADATGDAKWRDAADECFAWLEKGPLTDWNWDGQFEDIEPCPPYQDLTKHNAIETLLHLLGRHSDEPAARKLAREILRWSEDQFVFWEAPCAPDAEVPRAGAKPGTFSPGRWHYPSVYEQYSCYISIDASAAKMIAAYLAMYRAEKNPLDLAKARVLANAITQMQESSGRVPTFWAAKDDWISDVRYDWLNCMAASAAALLDVAAAENEVPVFLKAVPVWPRGSEKERNAFFGFRAIFDADASERPIIRITGCSDYRITLNGRHVGWGPARAAKGYFRVDEIPLSVRTGQNVLAVEVAGYNCNSFYHMDQPSFLQAEVVSNGRVLAATGTDGLFEAQRLPRVQKVVRYSYQRTFSELYRLVPGFDDWKSDAGAAFRPTTLAEQPAVRLLPRRAPYADFHVNGPFKPISSANVVFDATRKTKEVRFVDKPGSSGVGRGFAKDELEENWWDLLQRYIATNRTESVAADTPQNTFRLCGGASMLFDAGQNDTGFLGLHVKCLKPGRLAVKFDEILVDGEVNPMRYACANVVVWDFKEGGEYDVESFEPYVLKYADVIACEGEFEISAPHLRTYKNPNAWNMKDECPDPDVRKILEAARETFAQNSADVFTDCPGRERAGWLCDSFFLGRANHFFTGDLGSEYLFLENYLLADRFDHLPDGMLAMCYPADFLNGRFIPNWAMWLVIELDDFKKRGGDTTFIESFRPKLVKLVEYLKTFRNSDGLLEKLPSWVFVEWSQANKLVQDVNYPSNMTWAEVLDAMNRLYGMPELSREAQAVREMVRRQSWTGKWFCDNAVRQKDGSLKLSGECTETCQYYAFFFKTATPETHPELWKTLVEDFGPKRKETKKHPEIWPSNAFIGNYLRLECLSREGLASQVLDETKSYFLYMAEQTGTLWEHIDTAASCNHGFASYIAVLYRRNFMRKGIDEEPE